jgi:hypothetical protein
MQKFYSWIGGLTNTEIIWFSILVCGFMLFIPLADTFFKLIKKLVFMKRMSVKFFSYQFYPIELTIEKDGKRVKELIETPDFVIEGSKVLLYWEVEGALSTSLYPRYGKVKGNFSEVIVNRKFHEFQLIVKGLFSKETITISIPLDKIKTLETEIISDKTIYTEVPLIDSYGFTEGDQLNKSFTSDLNRWSNCNQNVVSNLSFVRLPFRFTKELTYIDNGPFLSEKLNLKKLISENKIMKQYTFSTKKYNQVNNLKNN